MWRTEKEQKNLSSDIADLDIRAPVSLSGWVNPLTNVYFPVNRIVLLARTIANVKQVAEESETHTDCASPKLTHDYSPKPNAPAPPTSRLASLLGSNTSWQLS